MEAQFYFGTLVAAIGIAISLFRKKDSHLNEIALNIKLLGIIIMLAAIGMHLFDLKG